MVERVEKDESVKAVVLASGKKGSWIAGANIKQIEEIKSVEQASEMVGVGQKVMDRVSDMQKKKPWIAAIDGACLGGGLEMAMTCSQRIASSSSKTVLGVPEVMLGLLPGWGGTQRLPKIVGAANALDMMLTGKMIKGDRARKMGLVDSVVDPNALERTAIATAEQVRHAQHHHASASCGRSMLSPRPFATASSPHLPSLRLPSLTSHPLPLPPQLADGTTKPKMRKLGWMDWFLEKTPVVSTRTL